MKKSGAYFTYQYMFARKRNLLTIMAQIQPERFQKLEK